MKPGVYADMDAVSTAEARYWEEFGFRFGKWQFLPGIGTIRVGGERKAQLTPAEASVLEELIKMYPGHVKRATPTDTALKVFVGRIRAKTGGEVIVSEPPWGYRFNPEGVI